MEFDDVNTFLQIVNDGNIAQAANNLFVSQGTVSLRLQRLEKELGISLLYRRKGVKKVELTAEGEVFLPIARQWVTLNQQAMNIKEKEMVTELRIAANTSSNLVLSEYYPHFSMIYPNVNLFLQTEHSYEAHQMIQNQIIDIGFTNSLHNFSFVTSTPLWSEKMVLLMHRDNPYLLSGDYADLDISKEIHSALPSSFQDWYHTTFKAQRPLVTIGDISLLNNYLVYPETWSIVSENVADTYCMKYDRLIKVHFKGVTPPNRISYLLRYKVEKPWIEKQIDVFVNGLVEYVGNNTALTVLYDKDRNLH